jgi:two-component system, LytTR family, response regulator
VNVFRAVLVDDEPHAREELRALLEARGDVLVVGQASNALEALQAVRRDTPDVLFLDVHMPVVNGFELLAMLDPEHLPLVVFVTAHDAFAIRAFEENAVDYLLKPVSAERLGKAVERLRLRGWRHAAPLAAPALTRVPCLAGRAVKLVPLPEIEYVRSGAGGVYVVSAAGEFFTELTLKVLEERGGLLRCHKQHLVNAERIDEIRPGDDPAAIIRTRSGHEVPVSRRFLAAVKERLGF